MNIPEHEPQVGQPAISISVTSSSLTLSSAAITMTLIRSTLFSANFVLPASIGPPDTKTVGMLSRMAAFNIPGVILSQLLIHTRASAQ